MKKGLKLLGVAFLCTMLLGKVSAWEVCEDICENIEITPTNPSTCYKEDYFKDFKAIVQYIKDNEKIEACDNPNLSILTSIDSCDLEGWYLDKELTKKVTGTTIKDVLKEIEIKTDENGCVTEFNYITNLYAKCKEPKSCPTDMNLAKQLMYNNEGVITKVNVKNVQNLLTPTKEGYIFDGWYFDEKFTKKVEGTTTASIDFTPVYDEDNCLTSYQDVMIYAKWIKIPDTCTNEVNKNVKITYVIDENESKSTTVNITDNVQLLTATKEGYTFEGWYYDEKLTNKVNDLTFVQQFDEKDCLIGYKDITVYAKWSKIEKDEPVVPEPENPDTGDNIVIYGICGVILLAGCALVIKKLTNK